jgi:hypothetical protein
MITIQATDLYKAANQVKRTEFWKTLPVLNHALLQLTDEGLKITTYAFLPADKGSEKTKKDVKTSDPVRYWGNGERWSTCVPMVNSVTNDLGYHRKSTHKYHPFIDWLKVAAEYKDTLELEFVEQIQTLRIKSGKTITEFKCLDAQEFPSIS